jgi:thiamine biosynthesis protein ThiI
MYSHFLIHYAEIALKKKNRPLFEIALANNIRRRVEEEVIWVHGRFVLQLAPASDVARLSAILEKTFGIANFAPALRTAMDLGEIASAAVRLAAQSGAATFKVDARRQHKGFPFTSVEVNRTVGAAIGSALPMKVNLDSPELRIRIEITNQGVYVYANPRPGPGGLPAGVAGRVVALVSGGIDSPVAAIRAMQRGCKCILVHFHNYTFYSEQVRNKILALASKLSDYNGRTKIIIVPFAGVQREIVKNVDPGYRMLSYRRAMLRIAARIARSAGAKAFVTGDSLSQVASQTLDNLAVINCGAELPVLSPLIACDKKEITELARRYGTFDISTQPYNDCCSAFVARRPIQNAKRETLEEMEEDIDFEALAREALAAAEVLICRGELDLKPGIHPVRGPALA